ncbi:ABC transporter permease [Paracoccus aestuariivivens]|uniref:ABC transporter permease subunit n=1 Tax=Paracoccus aestuariivivens TaxID=1820333 RepID=A0A6L6JGJ4_9RHOB|nr:ABC transporter permease [Paracoccus aestuariivivens]MTH79264.1 ABC transporter permease subunit [Paracoccus aestuariivivens]
MSRPAILFALIGLSGIVLPLVQFKPNRIAAGEGVVLITGFGWGAAVALGLAAILVAGCWAGWAALTRLAVALLGVVAVTLSLGMAARHLAQADNALARVSPAGGFWLLLLAFSLMFGDAITRLRPSAVTRWLILCAVLVLIAVVLATGLLDGVSVMREYAARREPFLNAARTHLLLGFGSLGLALAVGLPLGMVLFHAPRIAGPVLAALNVVQTIPSLALFGIMIPLFGWLAATLPTAAQWGLSGIGIFPAMTALFLYALLPVVSNTVAGLSGVPVAIREAAEGLGMTRPQILMRILVPLALPVLLAAVRIVLVQNIGLGVIAGLIGGGGFGSFVFQGLNQTAMDLVLLGALPTIALALLAGIVMDLLVDLSQRRA